MGDRHLQGREVTNRRRVWAGPIARGEVDCRLCGTPILEGQTWDLGHDRDLQLGGDPRDDTYPEHALKADCPAGGNRSAGAALAARLKAGRRRRLEAWIYGDDPRTPPVS